MEILELEDVISVTNIKVAKEGPVKLFAML